MAVFIFKSSFNAVSEMRCYCAPFAYEHPSALADDALFLTTRVVAAGIESDVIFFGKEGY